DFGGVLRCCSSVRFLRRHPINHRSGNFLPIGSLEAVVADSIAIPCVFAYELVVAVFKNEFFSVRSANWTRRRGRFLAGIGRMSLREKGRRYKKNPKDGNDSKWHGRYAAHLDARIL